jgi:hypothetical protein
MFFFLLAELKRELEVERKRADDAEAQTLKRPLYRNLEDLYTETLQNKYTMNSIH